MARYAQQTSVSAEKSRNEIERDLRCEVPGCPTCAQLFPDTIPADPK